MERYKSILKKCEICSKEYYNDIDAKEVCRDHFFMIYFKTRDIECIKAELRLYLEDLSEGRKIHKQTLELFKEIKKRYPRLIENFPSLADEVKKLR